jgi:hypothetical protein
MSTTKWDKQCPMYMSCSFKARSACPGHDVSFPELTDFTIAEQRGHLYITCSSDMGCGFRWQDSNSLWTWHGNCKLYERCDTSRTIQVEIKS